MRTVKNLDVLSKDFNAVKNEGEKKRRDDAEKMKRCEKYHFETEKGVRQKKYKLAAGKSCSLFDWKEMRSLSHALAPAQESKRSFGRPLLPVIRKVFWVRKSQEK